jgi:hypothetical protein
MIVDRELVPLRRTIRPYVGQFIIFVGFVIFCIVIFIKTSESAFLWLSFVPLLLFGISIVCFGMKYKVLWNKESVVMCASGGPERRIRFDEITSVKKETSSGSDVLAQSRPFRRIAVYRGKDDPNTRVDISLRHFDLNDINQLLAVIHAHRPDLDIPTIQCGNAVNHRGTRY